MEVAEYWEQVVNPNNWQQQRIAKLVVQRLFNTVAGKRIALFGFAFKADTNDTRESPAIRIAKDLLEEGAQLAFMIQYLLNRFSAIWCSSSRWRTCWQQSLDPVQACEGADAVLILTEWRQFNALDWHAIASAMRRPAWLFDTRATANTQESAVGLQCGP